MAEVNIVTKYTNGNSKVRIGIIFHNYSYFPKLIEGYKEGLIHEITTQTMYNKRRENGDLGIRIQSSGHHSDMTANAAIENVMIGNLIDEGILSEDILEYVDDRQETTQKIIIYLMMKGEYNVIQAQMESVYGLDKEILIPYMTKQKNVYEIADKVGIEPDSVRKRIYRIKKNLTAQVEPFFGRIQ